jgi:hypothetical protein
MKIAIQQPYFYPYIGYFELIKSVDKFVFFNDVQYIRRGWINRNKIYKESYITIPVKKSIQKTKINQIKINYEHNWHHKHCRTLEAKYGKKCLNHPIYLFYKNIPKYIFLVDLLKSSIKNVCNFLKIETEFLDSEGLNINENIVKENRIIEICKKLDASHYYNLPGGVKLYNKENFNKNNIDLKFIDTNNIKNNFSILDLCLS